MPPAIRFDAVSKRYTIDRWRQAEVAPMKPGLLGRLAHTLRPPSQRSTRYREDVWALKDVTFQLGQGEVCGIIGPNGAGKSTLLKLLARVTEPTSGWVGVNGRVTSLLEVGTGFHPELTGRENVFLNGAILGMSERKIRERFDRIVDFAGVERYLDVPVKRYSSGMYVRLAFAIAAHLDHEIMVVDEVLSVGDAAFRERCLSHIETVVRESGRTVIFVSHDLTQVQRLANFVVLMDAGEVVLIDRPATAIERYLGGLNAPRTVRSTGLVSSLVARPIDKQWVESGDSVEVIVELAWMAQNATLELELTLDDQRLLTLRQPIAPESRRLVCTLENLMLAPGTYRLDIQVNSPEYDLGRAPRPIELLVLPPSSPAVRSGEGPLAVRARWQQA